MRVLILLALFVLGGCAGVSTKPVDMDIPSFTLTKPIEYRASGNRITILPGEFFATGRSLNEKWVVFTSGKAYAQTLLGVNVAHDSTDLWVGFEDEELVYKLNDAGFLTEKLNCDECPRFTREELGL